MASSRDPDDPEVFDRSFDALFAQEDHRGRGGSGGAPDDAEPDSGFDDLSQLEGHVDAHDRLGELPFEDSDFARELMGIGDEGAAETSATGSRHGAEGSAAPPLDGRTPEAPTLEAPPSVDAETEAPPLASSPPTPAEEGPPPLEDAPPPGASPPSPAEELVWEELLSASASARPDPELFASAVATFIASPALERDGLASDLRTAAHALREADALEPLADAVERLALESGDPPDEACLAIARSLVTPGVGAVLAHRLGAAREEERRAQLLLLGRRIGQEMAMAVAEALSDTSERFARRAYLDAMVAMGADGARVIERMADDPRWFVVRNALTILGEVGGERAVEVLTGALAHEDPRVRREAILALAKLGGEDAAMLVYGMLEDADTDVRLAAAMAAGALKVERALRPLLAILGSETDDNVIVATLQALGQLGDPGAVNAIEKKAVGSFFSKPRPPVRIAAYRALQRIGTPHAMQVLRAAADDKDAEVRGAVRHLLGT